MLKFFIQLLDWLYLKKCYFCKSTKENTFMCQNCYDEIVVLFNEKPEFYEKCPVFSASIYEKNVLKMIRAMKYYGQKELCFFAAKILWEFIQTTELKSKKFVIVPVPLHKDRLKKRKYNHMELVAKELSLISGAEINTKIVERAKNTKPQYKLSLKERSDNLKNAFKINIEKYNNEELLIIDDIKTTGATLKEIFKELKKSGINKITALTISKT